MEEKMTIENVESQEKLAPKRFKKTSRKKVCTFCVDKCTCIDYKDVNKLKRYITNTS